MDWECREVQNMVPSLERFPCVGTGEEGVDSHGAHRQHSNNHMPEFMVRDTVSVLAVPSEHHLRAALRENFLQKILLKMINLGPGLWCTS